MGQNFDSQQSKTKQDILARIGVLDELSDSSNLSLDEWEERYNLDKQLQQILTDEEVQWQRRSGVKWILEGDSNSSYFSQMCQW